MSRYYFNRDDLWWQVIAVMFSATICFSIIWAILNPAKPKSQLEYARSDFSFSCRSEDGVVNVGSNNPKEWTCRK